MSDQKIRYHVSLRFEGISLPPCQDILILGTRCPQGPEGIKRCFNLLAPDEFQVVEMEEEENICAVLINRKILARLPSNKVIEILRERVFPFISKGELIRVDFKVALSYDELEGVLKETNEITNDG